MESQKGPLEVGRDLWWSSCLSSLLQQEYMNYLQLPFMCQYWSASFLVGIVAGIFLPEGSGGRERQEPPEDKVMNSFPHKGAQMRTQT